MTLDEICFELTFVDTAARGYRKKWKNKFIRYDRQTLIGHIEDESGVKLDEKLTTEDRTATDWCVETRS